MEKLSGSEKLLKRPTKVDKATLAKLSDLSASAGRVLDWCWYGQPAIDRFCGTVAVKPGAVGKLVEQLLQLDHPRVNLDVFPYGIPVDEIHVRIRSGGF